MRDSLNQALSRAKRRNKALKFQLDSVQAELLTVIADRNRYREYLRDKFKWLVTLQSEAKSPNLTFFIGDIASLFSRSEKWWW